MTSLATILYAQKHADLKLKAQEIEGRPQGALVVSGTAFSITQAHHTAPTASVTQVSAEILQSIQQGTIKRLEREITQIEQEKSAKTELIKELKKIETTAYIIERFMSHEVTPPLYKGIAKGLQKIKSETVSDEELESDVFTAQHTQDINAEQQFLKQMQTIAQVHIASSFEDIQGQINRHFTNLSQMISNLQDPDFYKGKTDYKTLIQLSDTVDATLFGFKQGRRNEPGIVGEVKAKVAELNQEITAHEQAKQAKVEELERLRTSN